MSVSDYAIVVPALSPRNYLTFRYVMVETTQQLDSFHFRNFFERKSVHVLTAQNTYFAELRIACLTMSRRLCCSAEHVLRVRSLGKAVGGLARR